MDLVCFRRATQVNHGFLRRSLPGDEVLFNGMPNLVLIEDLTDAIKLANRQHDVRPGSPASRDLETLLSCCIDHDLSLPDHGKIASSSFSAFYPIVGNSSERTTEEPCRLDLDLTAAARTWFGPEKPASSTARPSGSPPARQDKRVPSSS